MAFEGLTEKLTATFKKMRSKGRLTPTDVKEGMRDVRLALLEADVNYKVTKDFIANVTEKALGEEVLTSLTPEQHIIKIVNDELTNLMGVENAKVHFSSKLPTILMMCGLQGSGKTTHSGKLALYFKNMGKRPLLVACDIYRPAAIEQLKIVGQKIDVPVFEMGETAPLIVSKKAIAHAKDHGYDMVILDTAGRLHIDEELMNELKEIKEQVNPTEVMLVIDSMTGQDAVNVAQKFDELLSIDGIILTKLDGDTRGGAALSVRAVTGKPIKFVGMGEKVEDLEIFYPDRMASRILGMGDMLSLIEKAQLQFDEKSALDMAKKMKSNTFDFNDLLNQMKQIKKMGSLSSIMNMIPGVAGKINDEEAEQGEKQMKRVEAIISSMTIQERTNPSLINPKRKRRIATGSGTKVEDINRLLKQIEQMQKMMKQFSGGKKGKRKQLPFGNIPNMPF